MTMCKSTKRLSFTLFLLTFLGSCRIDYLVSARYIYINETSHRIDVENYPFSINPWGQFIIEQSDGGPKDVNASPYVPLLSGGEIIMFDSLKCIILHSGNKVGEGDGPVGIANYDAVKLEERSYEFTYHFTNELYDQAEPCN